MRPASYRLQRLGHTRQESPRAWDALRRAVLDLADVLHAYERLTDLRAQRPAPTRETLQAAEAGLWSALAVALRRGQQVQE